MRWTKLLLVISFAAFTFGGSFECHGHSGGNNHNNQNQLPSAR